MFGKFKKRPKSYKPRKFIYDANPSPKVKRLRMHGSGIKRGAGKPIAKVYDANPNSKVLRLRMKKV